MSINTTWNTLPSNKMAPEVKFTKDPKGNLEIRMSAICYASTLENRTKAQVSEEVDRILGLYPKWMLVITEWKKTGDDILIQCLEILQKIKETIICVDYWWSKRQEILTISSWDISIDGQRINIYNNEKIIQIAELIKKWGYKAYIHLPNWILQIVVMFSKENNHIILKAKKFLPDCMRSKRKEMRATLSNDSDIEDFIRVKWDTDKALKLTIIWQENTLVWRAMDISRWGIGFYSLRLPEKDIKQWSIIKLSLPFLGWREFKVQIRKIAHWQWFHRFWAKFIFADDNEKEIIWNYVAELDEKLRQWIQQLKEEAWTKYIDK